MRFLFCVFTICTLMSSCANHSLPKSETANADDQQQRLDVKAQCFENDTVKGWETRYCLQKSGAADTQAEAFKTECSTLRNDTSIPTDRCERIIWLKEHTCVDDKMIGLSREDCLADKDYLKKVSDLPYMGP